MEQILKPVGLRYQVEEGVLVLSRQDEGTQPPKSGASTSSRQLVRAMSPTTRRRSGSLLHRFFQPKNSVRTSTSCAKPLMRLTPSFELKTIDWGEVRRRYEERLDPAANADQFYRLLFQLVNELKDTHSWLQNYHPAFPASGPGLTVDLFEGKPFIVAVNADSEAAGLGVKPGSEVA